MVRRNHQKSSTDPNIIIPLQLLQKTPMQPSKSVLKINFYYFSTHRRLKLFLVKCFHTDPKTSGEQLHGF